MTVVVNNCHVCVFSDAAFFVLLMSLSEAECCHSLLACSGIDQAVPFDIAILSGLHIKNVQIGSVVGHDRFNLIPCVEFGELICTVFFRFLKQGQIALRCLDSQVEIRTVSIRLAACSILEIVITHLMFFHVFHYLTLFPASNSVNVPVLCDVKYSIFLHLYTTQKAMGLSRIHITAGRQQLKP